MRARRLRSVPRRPAATGGERGAVRGERGETLLELVIAIAVLGLVVVAVASGISLSVMESGVHRKLATAGAYVRDYAESVEAAVAAGGYVPCATRDSYPPVDVPAGYAASVTAVAYWRAGAWRAAGCTAANDQGLQRLTLQVASADSGDSHGGAESLVVVVREPCGTGSSCG